MTRTTSSRTLPGSGGRANLFVRPPQWLVVLVGIAAASAVLFAVTRLTSTDAYAPQFSGGPRAQISQSTFDYGDVKNNTQVQTTFTIRNVGDKQLYFPEEPVVQVVEGCCPPSARIDKSELNPGETAQVSLNFSMHAGMDGPHDFRVKVRTNDAVEPEQEVVILSNWVP